MKIKLSKTVSITLLIFFLIGFPLQAVSANDSRPHHGRIILGYHFGEGPPLSPTSGGTQSQNQNTPAMHISPNQPSSVVPANSVPNPLTGMPMSATMAGRRPLAISMSNQTQALPMNGISHADIVFEMLVEGGITRMIGLYQDISNVGLVGSIRSARHYTACIAESFDAILISAGGSPQAYSHIAERGITHLDEVRGNPHQMFRRDINRIPGRTVERYHSAVTTGELVTRWLPEIGVRLTHGHDHLNALFFVNDATPVDGGSADRVVVNFTSSNHSTFTFNNATRAYTMLQPQGNFIDANDNSQPNFTNLLILRTSVTPIPGDYAGRMEIETVGHGSGYFVNGGRAVKIHWFRPGEPYPFIFMRRDGSILTLGRGNTYIGIISENMNVTFE